jgi:hypothetical protein
MNMQFWGCVHVVCYSVYLLRMRFLLRAEAEAAAFALETRTDGSRVTGHCHCALFALVAFARAPQAVGGYRRCSITVAIGAAAARARHWLRPDPPPPRPC